MKIPKTPQQIQRAILAREAAAKKRRLEKVPKGIEVKRVEAGLSGPFDFFGTNSRTRQATRGTVLPPGARKKGD